MIFYGGDYMELFIIRHGDPDYARDSLTEKGVREAKLLSERMEKENIDYFYDLSKKTNTKRTPLYDRKPKLHRESYKEIQDKYLTDDQTEELGNRIVKRCCSTKNGWYN